MRILFTWILTRSSAAEPAGQARLGVLVLRGEGDPGDALKTAVAGDVALVVDAQVERAPRPVRLGGEPGVVDVVRHHHAALLLVAICLVPATEAVEAEAVKIGRAPRRDGAEPAGSEL